MLGQEFTKQLRGHDVVGWDRQDLDITNEQAVAEKISALKPSVIFNCAAYNNVDKAEDEPEIANAINGEAVGYLARAAAASGATFVHFSTDYVFSGNLNLSESYAAAHDFAMGEYAEDDVPDPISVYGKSKVLGERKEQEVFASHPSLILPSGRGGKQSVSPPFEGGVRGGLGRWYIIRTSKLFGPPGIGETSKKSFPEMMIGFARAKGKIEAIDAEVGSPTYVKDLAEAVLRMVAGGAASGIYHITNSGACTWYEYAKAAVEFSGVQAEVVPVPPERFPRKAKRPGGVVLLNSKFPPLRGWQEALREFLT